MLGGEEFGPNFQRVLVRACMDDLGLKSLVQRFVQAGQLGFTDPGSAWAWRVVADSDHATVLMLTTEAGRLTPDDPARPGVATICTAAPDIREHEYARQQVVEWARRQVFAAGFEAARAAWNRGDVRAAHDTMMHHMEDYNRIHLGNHDRGWFFEEFEERQSRRWAIDQGLDRFPIGIERIDRAMQGGLAYTELEVPLAYSGVGKTFYCVQRGFVAVRMRRRCLHMVLEGGRAKTEDRYEARFAESLYHEVRRGSMDEATVSRIRSEYRLLRGNLVVRGFADKQQWRVTPDDILAELGELRRQFGWVPDLLVVDYGDLVWADGEDDRERQKRAFQALKAIAERIEFRGHRGYAVCAPSQARRPAPGADEREHVLKPQDIADSYDKVKTADAIVSLNRTNGEKKEGIARVFLGKYRDAEDGLLVRVRTDYAHGAFSVLGAPEPDRTAPAGPPA